MGGQIVNPDDPCPECENTRKCAICEGTGDNLSGQLGDDGKELPYCNACDGSGECFDCFSDDEAAWPTGD